MSARYIGHLKLWVVTDGRTVGLGSTLTAAIDSMMGAMTIEVLA